MQEQIKELQARIQDLESNIKRLDQLNQLQSKINSIEAKINKNDFSNLYVFDVPVKFRRSNIFPKDETSIETSTTNSTGRISIKDEEGTVRQIPYF